MVIANTQVDRQIQAAGVNLGVASVDRIFKVISLGAVSRVMVIEKEEIKPKV